MTQKVEIQRNSFLFAEDFWISNKVPEVLNDINAKEFLVGFCDLINLENARFYVIKTYSSMFHAEHLECSLNIIKGLTFKCVGAMPQQISFEIQTLRF